MFNEDIQEDAFVLMKRSGLQVGRFLEVGDAVIANAVVGTDEDGDFWYGDLDLNEDVSKLRTVAVALGKTLNIVGDTTQMRIPAV